MNDKENTNVIEKVYEQIKEGDVTSVLNVFAEDVQCVLPKMDNVAFAGVWRGHDGVRKFFANVFEVQDVLYFEPQEYIAQG